MKLRTMVVRWAKEIGVLENDEILVLQLKAEKAEMVRIEILGEPEEPAFQPAHIFNSDEIKALNVSELGFNKKTINALGVKDILTIGDLLTFAAPPRKLLEIRLFQYKSFRLCRKSLQAKGIKLGAEWKLTKVPNENWEPDI